MSTTIVKEPEFFLKAELIYFLKKNAQIKTVIRSPDPGTVQQIVETRFFICDELICSTSSLVPPVKAKVSVEEVSGMIGVQSEINAAKSDIGNLIHHLLEQQKRIEALEKHLAQYTTS